MSRKLPNSMHERIYHAYLHGPHALFGLFKEAFGRQALCEPAEPDQQQRTIDGLSTYIIRLKAQIEKLKAEVSQLHYRNFQLQRRNTSASIWQTDERLPHLWQ